MRRIVAPEHIDDPKTDPRDLDRAMAFLRKTNARMGGIGAMLAPLKRWSAGWPRGREITMLDIGTGSADLPLAARQWARREGFDLRITAVDVSDRMLAIARRQLAGITGVTLVQADAWDAIGRFGPGSFDYVHSGLFLHHFQDAEIPRLLTIFDRVAKRGLIVHDILRSNRGWIVWWLMTAALPRVVRHDARVSYKAGFTGVEIRHHASEAGLTYCGYSEHIGHQRWTLCGERPSIEAARA